MFTRYLVTGGLGLTGGAVVERLLQANDVKIVILDNLFSPSPMSPDTLSNPNVKIVFGDVSNETLVLQLLKDNEIDCVIDCSARSDRTEALKLFQNAVQGITHLLDAVRAYGKIKSMLLVSSISVYGTAIHDEKNSLAPVSFRGGALMGAEAMLHSYVVSYRLPLAIVRLTDGVAEGVAAKIRNGLPVSGFINLLPVADAAQAIVLAAQVARDGEVFNVGGDADFDIETIRKVVVYDATTISSINPTNINLTKAKTVLGFSASCSVLEALQFTPLSEKSLQKVLLFGSNGAVGEHLLEVLKKTKVDVETSATVPAIETIGKLNEELAKIAPSHVIFLSVEEPEVCGSPCEQLRPLVRDLLLSPYILANLCEKYSIHFTHVSSGFVFGEDDKGEKTEDDRGAHQQSTSGAVRCFTEKLIDQFPDALQIRLGLPVFKGKKSEDVKVENGEKTVSISEISSCLKAATKLIQERERGFFNLVNPGSVALSEAAGYSSASAVHEAELSNGILSAAKITAKFPEIPAAAAVVASP